MRRLMLLTAFSALALTGCRNACQSLCGDIVDYAEECGVTVPEDAKSECVASHKRGETTREERQVCSDNRSDLREEWTCDDVEGYVNGAR